MLLCDEEKDPVNNRGLKNPSEKNFRRNSSRVLRRRSARGKKKPKRPTTAPASLPQRGGVGPEKNTKPKKRIVGVGERILKTDSFGSAVEKPPAHRAGLF